jgi:hypothetical protein
MPPVHCHVLQRNIPKYKVNTVAYTSTAKINGFSFGKTKLCDNVFGLYLYA